jgi:NADH:ubiquinone oxidoreductase subunit F (NADH-binding)/(2Fe-2S) ferredoxin/Pyruvate/2-oxoacid:ferredoxin oxidoreductase delta subunit
MRFSSPGALEKQRKKLQAQAGKVKREILICAGTGCLAGGSADVAEAFRVETKAAGLKVGVRMVIKETGCHGFCEQGPLVILMPEKIFYQKVKPSHVKKIVQSTLIDGELVERLLYKNLETGERVKTWDLIDFYAKQHRLVLRNIGRIDPEQLDDYLAVGGYQGLPKALAMKPVKVIDVVKKSGLRGRGGGGFPTGRKWDTCRKVDDHPHYVICNADEGDPGAFMDRSICEGDPHAVIEGMIIGAHAVGANRGFIYVREEYPLARKRLGIAIEQAAEAGLLGENILGSGFDFTVEINRGGGAFVCGESSALMKSVAGEVGEPRAKYIHSVVKGLHDKPTVLNNVETFACVPYILDEGAKAFAAVGTKGSSGTKAFSLVGKVKNTGLVEVAMGITLRDIIFGVGGGIIGDRPFKAVQTGGPSGGCLPESSLDLAVDFDTLTAAGSMMGSGGMIVMDDRTCMVDVARYFVNFLVEESCGKCVPCREGLKQLLIILERICSGAGQPDDLLSIERLSSVLTNGSLCALGSSAANPVNSTLKYFRDEYQAHIEDHRCPGGVCKSLITYSINDACTGCTACVKVCAFDAISGKKKSRHDIHDDKCTRCGACIAVCPDEAIEVH